MRFYRNHASKRKSTGKKPVDLKTVIYNPWYSLICWSWVQIAIKINIHVDKLSKKIDFWTFI